MPTRAKSLVLAMDIGSSSLRTALFTNFGERLLKSTASRQYTLRYSPDGGAELDPHELLRAAKASVKETLRAQARIPIVSVAGAAIWHSLLGLNRDGEPITPIYTWADSRSRADAAELRREYREREIQLRTGCMLRAPYWPAKLNWLQRTNRSLFRRTARWISPGAWIFEKLFGAEMTSHSMASGTGLYNLATGAWDEELCEVSGVRVEQLGPLRDRCLTSSSILRDAAICSPIGDGAASNLGSDANRADRIAINIGTSAAVRRVETTPGKLSRGLFRYVVDERRFLIGGAISNAGNLRQWCLRELRLRENEPLGRVAAAADTLVILPFWVNERAPNWPEDLRGVISGLTPATSAGEILRTANTSTYYQLAEILDRLDPEQRADEIIVSGGVLHSKTSLEILADCLGRDLRVCRELESSLRGAAVHALEEGGGKVKPLRGGPVVRHRRDLAQQHRTRRAVQNSLERNLL